MFIADDLLETGCLSKVAGSTWSGFIELGFLEK
jgi:hypothetical protein